MTTVDQLLNDFHAKLDSAFSEGARFMHDRLFDILSVQADVEMRGGRLRATTPAEPGAPPRRVSGKLQSFVGWVQDGPGTWSFGIMEGVFYARTLEFYQNHPYFSKIIENHGGEVQQIVTSRLQ